MTLAHNSSRRAKKARLLVLGERCYVLWPGNKWIDAFITGITDNGRSYKTEVEATGGQLTRNGSHIRPRSPDIPNIHASYLQHNSVLSATSDRNELSEREKTVLSAPRKGSIKQTNTSQVLVSDSARQEGPTEQRCQEDQVSGQPCEQHCANTTKKAVQT